ncbi:CRISPR-associated exonuclease Cas4/endonuclease Cas1 fusion [Corynebacterium diphtheriae]|nr:CRISPR-associated exonuclease Cas4/endonuclease Cas1 fusion [Corynebacterium diphtheriae]CAB0728325.1 CRISPR-associated exonuclease Cas4/endonuclease Cas1 fusion [Corynebacterium diphtheriae]
MNIDDNFLPISLVCHTQFCERRVWLEINGEKTDTSQMQSGFEAHQRVDNPKTSRSSKWTAMPLRCESLGLVGKADEVNFDEDGLAHIVEYKATPVRRLPSVTKAHKLQLGLQRLCLEESGFTVGSQAIYFSDHKTKIEVNFTSETRQECVDLVKRTREIVQSSHSPEVLTSAEQCSKCSHFSVCLPDEHSLTTAKKRINASSPPGQVVHLTVQGSRASISKGRLCVKSKGELLASVPIERIHGVVVHGNIDISSALNRQLLWDNVPIVWCSSTGRVYGFSQPTDGPNGLSRVEQHVLSSQGYLPIASAMIEAKIYNQATLLRRNSPDTEIYQELREYSKYALDSTSLPMLFGVEGKAAALYFDAFPSMLKVKKLSDLHWIWTGRHGRGADDPLNILLNYAYGLLRVETIRAILSCGLDPHAGFLHSSKRNKPALALDLMEEFRAPIADSVVISTVNRGEITPSDFTYVGGSARLREDGRRKLIMAFERRIQSSFKHPIYGYSVTWRRAIEVQARLILGVIDKSMPIYKGIKIR